MVPVPCKSNGKDKKYAEILKRRKYLEIDQSETRMACGGHVY
jgi:hypothetical protein